MESYTVALSSESVKAPVLHVLSGLVHGTPRRSGHLDLSSTRVNLRQGCVQTLPFKAQSDLKRLEKT